MTPTRRAPAGQQMIRNATAPHSSAKLMYSSQRMTVKAALTTLFGDTSRAGTWVALGAPMENANSPETGWVSSEITCQTAVYVPLPSPGSSVTAISSGLASVVSPSSARSPSGL